MTLPLMRGEPAGLNPWRALTLEWQVSSPPPIFNFDEIPQVVGSLYEEYGVRARHAVMNGDRVPVDEPEPEKGPIEQRAAAHPRRGQRDGRRQDLIDALRKRAAEGPIRVTVVSLQNEPRAGFVVVADSRRSSAERCSRRTPAGPSPRGRIAARAGR